MTWMPGLANSGANCPNTQADQNANAQSEWQQAFASPATAFAQPQPAMGDLQAYGPPAPAYVQPQAYAPAACYTPGVGQVAQLQQMFAQITMMIQNMIQSLTALIQLPVPNQCFMPLINAYSGMMTNMLWQGGGQMFQQPNQWANTGGGNIDIDVDIDININYGGGCDKAPAPGDTPINDLPMIDQPYLSPTNYFTDLGNDTYLIKGGDFANHTAQWDADLGKFVVYNPEGEAVALYEHPSGEATIRNPDWVPGPRPIIDNEGIILPTPTPNDMPQVKVGEWLAPHDGVTENADGSFTITAGDYAGHTAEWSAEYETFVIYNPDGDMVARYNPPNGADAGQLTAPPYVTPNDMPRIKEGEWLAPHDGITENADGSFTITEGDFAGHLAEWSVEYDTFVIYNPDGDMVARYNPPNGADSLAPTPEDMPQVKEGEWLAPHDGVTENADGSFTITDGDYAGHTAEWSAEDNAFVIFDQDDTMVGRYIPPNGADSLAPTPEDMPQISEGEWLAPHDGVTENADGSFSITDGDYAGHTAEWSAEDNAFVIFDQDDAMVARYIPPNGADSLAPTPEDMPQISEGEWLAPHDGVTQNADGSFTITDGDYAGHTAEWSAEDNAFVIFDQDDTMVGRYIPPNGADSLAPTPEDMPQISEGEWLAPHDGVTENADGSFSITDGDYAGHTAEWSAEDNAFVIFDQDDAMVARYIPPNGADSLAPTPEDMPQISAGEWLAPHDGVTQNADGSFSITDGDYAGHTAEWSAEDNAFVIFDQDDAMVARYIPPNGADSLAPTPEDMPQVKEGEWLAPHDGVTENADGSFSITEGDYAGHTAEWSADDNAFVIFDQDDAMVARYIPPNGADSLAPTPEDMPQVKEGEWLAPHDGVTENADGSFSITEGDYAGHTAEWSADDNAFVIFDQDDAMVARYIPPNGADSLAPTPEDMPQISAGEWLAPYDGVTRNDDGSFSINEGEYAGHTAEWSTEDNTFAIFNPDGDLVAHYDAPDGTDRLAPTLADAPQLSQGEWLAPYGGVSENADGSFTINEGDYAGHTAEWSADDGAFAILDAQGDLVGRYTPPNGADGQLAPTLRDANQVKAGEWLAPYGGVTENADGSFNINEGEYAGHTAEWSADDRAFAILDAQGELVGTYIAPHGADRLTPTLADMPKISQGEWLAPYQGITQNADGTYDINKGEYAGHTAEWSADDGAFAILDAQGELVGRYTPPNGADGQLAPTLRDANQVKAGEWLAPHDGVTQNADGSFTINEGDFAGHTAEWSADDGAFAILDAQGDLVGRYAPPNGADGQLAPTLRDANQVKAGEWLAPYGGVTENADGSFTINEGDYAGHTAEWSADDGAFAILDAQGELVGTYIAPNGADRLTPTLADMPQIKEGEWLAPYQGITQNADGTYDINKGEYAGHTAEWSADDGAFAILDAQGELVGRYTPPNGADGQLAPTLRDANQVKAGEWLAPYGGVTENADGSFNINEGEYAGHTAEWSADDGAFAILDAQGELVGTYIAPHGADRLTPTLADLPQLRPGEMALIGPQDNYTDLGDNNYLITEGTYADHTAKWDADNSQFVVYDPEGNAIGRFEPPSGRPVLYDRIVTIPRFPIRSEPIIVSEPVAPTPGDMPQIKAGEWLAPYEGVTANGDGSYNINKGDYAGHTAEWSAEDNTYAIYNPEGDLVARYNPPTGTDINMPITALPELNVPFNPMAVRGATHEGRPIIVSGPYAGHSAKWDGDIRMFVTYDPAGNAIGLQRAIPQAFMYSPIAFDLNGDGKIGTTGNSTAKERIDNNVGETVQFDIDGDGDLDTIEWMSGDGDGLLVDNRDGNVANDMDGARLYGDEGGKYENGYVKLSQLDTDDDGQISGKELEGLAVWVDDGDAVVEEGEMMSAADAGITRISTEMTLEKNERGEDLMRSDATIDGKEVMTEDVWFAKDD